MIFRMIMMALSVLFFSSFLGYAGAVLFIGLLYIHEMGHYYAARLIGIPVTPPLFIPGVGAVIGMKMEPGEVSSQSEAFVGFCGPLAGTLGTLIAWPLQEMIAPQDDGMHKAIIYSFILNGFNLLIPIRPFDGGRVMQVWGKGIRWVGLIPLGLLLGKAFPINILIAVMILGEFSHPFEQTTLKQKLGWSGAYLALLVIIIFAGRFISPPTQ